VAVFTGQTVKHAIKYLLGTTARRDIDSGTQEIANSIDAALTALVPPGTIVATARATAPTGWLLCDGSAVSRTGANADLFAAIGTTYGAGNGTSTFNLPDFRGRVIVGVDGAAARMPDNDALGSSGGASIRTLESTSPNFAGAGGTADPIMENTVVDVRQPYQVANIIIRL